MVEVQGKPNADQYSSKELPKDAESESMEGSGERTIGSGTRFPAQTPHSSSTRSPRGFSTMRLDWGQIQVEVECGQEPKRAKAQIECPQ